MTTYYVSASIGNDSNDGTSQSTPIESIDKVNSLNLLPQDKVLFKRGDTWIRSNNDLISLYPPEGITGNYITYSNYGNLTDPLPIITMALDLSNSNLWTQDSTNIWSTPANIDVGNLIFNNKSSVGIKVFVTPTQQGQYFWNSSTKRLKLYSTSNPGTYYSNVFAVMNEDIIHGQLSRIIFDGLHLSMGNFGIALYDGSNNIIVRNNNISWIGGGVQSGTLRYGNGIEFWNSSHDQLIENNVIWEVYDAAMTTQGDSGAKYNETFRNNIVWNTEYGFEFWQHTGSVNNLHFENNTVYNSGGGWSHLQRPDPNGTAFISFRNTAPTTNVYIRNNLFLEAANRLLYFLNYGDWSSGLILDYNGYANVTSYLAAGYITSSTTWTNYPMSQFSQWKSDTGQDAHSIINQTNNFVLNAPGHDFHLKAGSPAIDIGTIVNVPTDFDGITRPQGCCWDLGAYEYTGCRNPTGILVVQ